MKRPIAVHHLRSALALALGLPGRRARSCRRTGSRRPSNTAAVDRRADAGRQAGAADAAPQRPGAGAAVFTIDKPARISLDLPGTALALPSRRIDVGTGGLDTVLAAEANGRARVVLNLDAAAALPDARRRQRHHRHASAPPAAGAGRGAVASAASTAAAAAPARRRAIRSIDFRRGDGGVGRLIVKLTDPRTPINLQPAGLADHRRLRRHRPAEEPGAPLRHAGLRHAGHRLRRACASATTRASCSTPRAIRAARLPVRRPVRGRGAAGARKAAARSGRRQEGLQRREAVAELPGHRHPRGAAAAGRRQRPEHRGQRLGQGQRDAAPAERALGPGARHRAAHQGPRQARARAT